ncbi:MAG: hypothetical protein AAF514_00155 [Verrucomicrobiota bacterium]
MLSDLIGTAQLTAPTMYQPFSKNLTRALALLALTIPQVFSAPVVVDDFEGGAFEEIWDQTDVSLSAGTGADGSATFASIAPSTGILGASMGGATEATIDFQVRVQATGDRQFNLMISNSDGVTADAAAVNLRHQNGWAVFSDGWQPLDLPAMDPDLWYRVRVSCVGWGSAGASYEVELSDAGGREFTSSVNELAFYQIGNPSISGVGSFSFNTKWGNNPGFEVDGVNVDAEGAIDGGDGGGNPPAAAEGDIVSDDFESDSLSADWDRAEDVSQSTGEGAGGSAKFVTLEQTTGLLGASLEGGAADVVIDFRTRVQETESRQFNLMVSNGSDVLADAAAINLRHQGGWAVFSDGWQALDLPTMDPGAWYRVRVTCHGWGMEGASYDIELSDAGGSEFTGSVTDLAFYQGGNPDTTSVGSFSFNTKWGTNPGFDLDDVSVNAGSGGGGPVEVGESIVMDDFEEGDFSDDWDGTDGAAVNTGEGALESGRFAAIEPATGLVGAVFDDGEGGASDVVVDFYTRVQVTGARQFNLMISTSGTVTADSPTVNLRHQNGWSVFSDGWRPLDLPVMEPDLWYRVRVTCQGWGGGGASYKVEMSDADGTEFTSAVNGLDFFQAGDPNTTPVGSFSFNTKWGDNPGFQIDSVSAGTVQPTDDVDDPNVTVARANPFAGIELSGNPDPVPALVMVENTGSTNDLIIAATSVVSGDAADNFSILTELPLTIAPGESDEIELLFDAENQPGRFDATLLLDSNDPSNPRVEVNLQTTVPFPSGSNLVGNGDFESDSENLVQWEKVGAPAPVAGFAPGSKTAASLATSERLLQRVNGESEWYLQFFFQVQETSARAFNVVLNAPGSEVNIRAQGSLPDVENFWNTFIVDDGWGEPIGLPGVVAGERYFMRIVGRGWDDESPASYDLLLSEPGEVTLAHRIEGLTRFRNGVPTEPIQSFRFTTEFGTNPGFLIDDVEFVNGTPPPAFPFDITGYTHNQDTNESTITWSAVPGTFYDVDVSPDLTPGSWLPAVTQVEANPELNLDTAATVPGNPDGGRSFFRIRQVEAPPLLETGFENGQGDWTVSVVPNGTETGTTWEFGPPTNGPDAARSGNNVVGTGLAADYEDGTTVLLQSPVVDPINTAGRLNLRFWYFLGAKGDEGGQVSLLEEDGSLIGHFDQLFIGGSEGNTNEWTEAVFPIPALDPVRPFRIQFSFLSGSDGVPNGEPGWFLDDVRIGK